MALQPLWLIGDWQHADFQEAHAWLECHAVCTFRSVADQAVAAESLIAPRAIVIAQSRPGQLAACEVERLHTAAPLAQLVALLGPWCEGEGRTGQPWPGVVRVPWRLWEARLPSVLGLASETTGSRRQSRTATEWERIEWSVQDSKWLRFRGNVQIHTGCLTTFRGWEGILARLGLKSAWISSGDEAPTASEIAFFDGWQSVSPGEIESEGSTGQARVLLLDWPRPEDVCRAKSLGFCAVLAQPLLFADLIAILAGMVPISDSGQESAA